MSYQLVDEDLTDHLKKKPQEQRNWVTLEPHGEFPGMWFVQGFDKDLFYNLGEFVGPYRVVSPAKLDEFLELCKEHKYEVAFFEDPLEILGPYQALNEPPPFVVNSDLPDTINGLLPFQIQGFNYLKDLYGGVGMWSTGTGKTVLGASLIKYHLMEDNFDTAWFVVKAHNKIDTQRDVKRLVDLDADILKGTPRERRKRYTDLAIADTPSINITNYEKFRDDYDAISPLFKNGRHIIIWDEMPTKLKSRGSQLYESICQCLYRTNPPAVNYERIRPPGLRQYMLSATPIERDPEDWFNCVRLLDPRVYGTVTGFRDEYVVSYNFFDRDKPEKWHQLDKMGLKASHITHQVDKEDPDIAKQFPEVLEETRYIDWNDQDRKIYDTLTDAADPETNVLALISLLQMVCDAPSMLTDRAAVYEAYEHAVEEWVELDDRSIAEPKKIGSATAYKLLEQLGDSFKKKLTNNRHTKLDTLRTLLTEEYPDEKILLFSAFNQTLIPILETYLQEWGVTYVRYTGKVEEADQFRQDPDTRLFLSSDKGSDSLNLEQGSVVVDYNLPLKWSTKIQRRNRVHRITSKYKVVSYISLMMANSVEDRRAEIIERKKGYHLGVFKGAIADRSASARVTKSDLLYILTGQA